MRKSLFHSALALILAGGLVAPIFADGTVDGTLGGAYGTAVAAGAAGDNANGGAAVDLLNMYEYDNGSTVFLALQTAPAGWGRFGFFIETDNATDSWSTGDPHSGNPWGTNINPDGTNVTPTFWLAGWTNGGVGAQLWSYTEAGGWSDTGFPVVASTTGGQGFEVSVSRANLGNPASIQLVGFSFGDSGPSGAVDALPLGNPTCPGGNWDAATTMSIASASANVPVELSAFGLD